MKVKPLAVASGLVLALAASGLSACGGGGGGGSSGGTSSSSSSSTTPAAAPVFTSGLSATVSDGATGTVYTAQATVAAGRTATYSLSGTDAAKFNIDASSGAVSFKSAPSYSSPGDADGDNEYLVTVSVSDGSQSVSINVSIKVTQSIASRPYTWTNATWGGGGYVTGILYHPSVSGLAYVRTDVGGVYRRDSASSAWVPLNDDIGRDDSQLTGVLSMAVDPNNSQQLYLAVGQYLPSWGRTAAILRSSDRGATWSRIELPIRLGGNSDGRGTGERLQVDPNKGSVLFLGTNQDGLYKSTDSGATWAKVSAFAPTGTTFVLFDKSTGTLGSATQTIYVGVATTSGSSLYRSTDGGASWSAVPGQPSGLMPVQGAFDANGHLYLTYANALGPNGITNGAVYKLTTATDSWANVTPDAPAGSVSFGYSGLSVDAQHPNTVVVSTIDRWSTGDDIYRSTDGGASWTALNAKSTHTAPNNPWVLAYANGSLSGKMGHWITDVDIDPFDSDSVIYNTGYGIWESHNLSAGTVSWAFDDKGIEETVVTDVMSPTAGAHLLMTQGDVAGARYTTLSSTDTSGYFTDPNVTGQSVDAAELLPTKIVRTSEASFGGYLSLDNGVTWSHLSGSPVSSGNSTGKIAITAAGTSMVWVPQNQGAYYSTTGTSWTAATGYPVVSGQYFAPVADRAVDGYVYTYDFTTGAVYESSNGGQSFAAVVTGLPTWKGSSLLSMPGTKRRDLWIGTTDGLYHIDGASASAVKLTTVQEVYLVSYGAPAPGQSYYALYIWGKIGGTVGLYRSDDKGATWTQINDAAHQFGWINDLSGDPRVYGRVYLATGGRGVIVGNR